MSTQNLPNSKFNQALTNMTIGMVIGLMDVIVVISFGALVFSGDLVDYVSLGINLLLFGGVFNHIFITLTTSVDGMISVSQDAPAALFGLELSVIGASLAVSADQDVLFYTAIATIFVATLLTGVVFILFGWFKLGVLVRYLPYPVVAGFLAGTGWFVFKGGLEIASDAGLHLSELGTFLLPEVLIRWLPALAAGVVFFWATRRFSQFWLLPVLFFATVGVFYLIILVSGTPLAQFRAEGWFLQVIGEDHSWQPVMLAAVSRADWGWVLSHLPKFFPVGLVSLISMLLNVSGIELSMRKDIDLDHELKTSGFANIINALLGNIVSFPTISLSILAQRSGKPTKLIGFSAAFVMLLVVVFGPVLLALVPKFIVGGLLVFLGLDFMVSWLVAVYPLLSRFEYAIIWLILISMTAIGVLEGVGIGLLLAFGLFVYNYSQTKVVKHTFSGQNYHSNVDRPQFYSRMLHQNEAWLTIFELQGYLFFGTTEPINQAIRERLANLQHDAAEFFVLDFRQVVGMDASAIQNFQRIFQLIEESDLVVVFSGMGQPLMAQLKRNVLSTVPADSWRDFQDLDHAVEWCEDQKIEAFKLAGLHERRRGLMQRIELSAERKTELAGLVEFLELDQESTALKKTALLNHIESYLEKLSVPAGEHLIHQGEMVRGMFFIEEGVTIAELKDHQGQVKRLRKMQSGTVVGEIGLYTSERASASVVALEDCQVYFLSREKLRQMEAQDVTAAAELHRFIAQLLSYRLSSSTQTIRSLQD